MYNPLKPDKSAKIDTETRLARLEAKVSAQNWLCGAILTLVVALLAMKGA